MTPNKRIVLNTAATYARTLLGLFVGLFCMRWLLLALGETDFGLFNAVGGIMPFVSVLNGIICASVARYYAYVIGECQKLDEAEATDALRKWFSTAIFLHTIIPLVLVIIGYPLGMYAVHHWFVIPPERVVACEWLVRCAFVSTFVTMLSAPYTAMYSARQLITELAFFGVLQTVFYALTTRFLFCVESDRLVVFSACTGAYMSFVALAQTARAYLAFPMCRVKLAYLFDIKRIKTLLSFSLWNFFNSFGLLVKNQGLAFVINRFFAPSVNAAYTVANQLSNQTNSLSSALQQALVPAVTTAEGASDHVRALKLAEKSCKFVTLLSLIFCVPLIAEIDTVLALWLKTPPAYTAELCICAVLAFLVNRVSEGYALAISADGRIAALQTLTGCLYLSGIPMAVFLVKMGCGPVSVGFTIVFVFFLIGIVRLVISRRLLKVSVWGWMKRIVIPVVLVSVLSGCVAWGCTLFAAPSFGRVVVTSAISASAASIFSWFIAFDDEERGYLKNYVARFF